ncbi:MAG: hypothetical protein M3256_20270 [Actinomycetota bacterium]|nr:hypothetical protein [Actinomycetota bacterium]
MATEFKVVFEGELNEDAIEILNRAIQSAVLAVLPSFPNPDDSGPVGPGGPVEGALGNAFTVNPRIRGIIFRPAE